MAQHLVPGRRTRLPRGSDDFQHQAATVIAHRHQLTGKPFLLRVKPTTARSGCGKRECFREAIPTKKTTDKPIFNIISLAKGKEISAYFLSSVLQLEWGRAGLCGGRLFGPSMLRDMSEHFWAAAEAAITLAGTVTSLAQWFDAPPEEDT